MDRNRWHQGAPEQSTAHRAWSNRVRVRSPIFIRKSRPCQEGKARPPSPVHLDSRLKRFIPQQWRPTRSQSNPHPYEVQQSCHQNGHDRKRKRLQSTVDPAPRDGREPISKRGRISSPVRHTIGGTETQGPISEPHPHIKHWAETGEWPATFFERGYHMSQPLVKRRSFLTMSYAQRVREGLNPTAHNPEYERKVLAPAGIILDQQSGEAAISADCKELCATLIHARYDPPEKSLFEGDLFWKVMNSIRSRNEPRVVRDIWPYIVPSAEHLELRGLLKGEHLREEVQTEWARCDSLAGPTPQPDLTVGLSSSAFTDDETGKLKNYSTFQRPTEVIESLYFPFLTCEAKVWPIRGCR